MANKLKVGVIGVGGIAGAHFPGWKNSPDAELVALADVSPDALKRVGEAQGVAPDMRFEKVEDLINHPDIDIIDVCTPNNYHAPLSIAALKAGKHVLCEKPLAPTPADVKKMIDARNKSKKLLMTAQHFRFQGSARALKNELDRGFLGDVYHARSWMLRRAAAPTRPGFILKKHATGGPCIDIGVHILDLTLWMLGFPKPVSVTGVTQANLHKLPGAFSIWGGAIPREFDVEEFAAAFVRFKNGATLVLEVSWLLHHKVPAGNAEDMQMWLYGTKGGSHWPSNELLSTRNDTKQLVNTQLTLADNSVAPHAAECIAFAKAVADGAPSPVPPEESLIVMSILDGLYRSAKAGKEVKL